MGVKEFYEKFKDDYNEVLSRLLTEERIKKYLKKLPETGDFENLKESLSQEKWDDAFRFSHNLKGMCLNLGLNHLFLPSSTLCENLRGGAPQEDPSAMMEEVERIYKETVTAIEELI